MYKNSIYNIVIREQDNGSILLFNSNRISLAWIDNDTKKTFWNKTKIDKDSLNDDIIKAGFVVEDSVDELDTILKQRKNIIEKVDSELISYVIAPTMKCNLNCEYCFQNRYDASTMDENMMQKLYNHILHQVSENKKCKMISISWFGGEPLLMKNQIITFMETLKCSLVSFGIDVSAGMITNGLLLTKEIAYEIKNAGISRVQITVDGFADSYSRAKGCLKDSFYVLINNIRNCCDILNIRIRLNVTKTNCTEMLDLAKYMLGNEKLAGKVLLYVARVVSYNGRKSSDLFSQYEFEEFKHKFYLQLIDCGYMNSIVHSMPRKRMLGCSSLKKSSRVFGPDGLLYKCEHCLSKKEFSVGTIDTGYEENDIEKLFVDSSISEKCKVCNLLPVCAMGCKADWEIEKSEIDCKAVLKRVSSEIDVYMLCEKQMKGVCDYGIDLCGNI